MPSWNNVNNHLSPSEHATIQQTHPRWLAHLVLGVLTVYFLVYPYLVLTTNINWDEFNFLANVYALKEGRASAGLNNFHVVLYGWLAAIPGSEIDQIIVARFFQLGLFAGSMLLLFALARQMFSKVIALLVVFLAVTYTDLIAHAYSFRFDPICLFFSLLALWLYSTRAGVPAAALAGLALALSFLVSIKTIFYAITITAIALYFIATQTNRHVEIQRLATLFFITLICFGIIFLLRTSNGDGPAAANAGLSMLGQLQLAGSKMFLEEGLLPKIDYLFRGMAQNMGHWLLVGAGTVIALASQGSSAAHQRRAVMVLICMLPLASVLIYRNSFPYFYVYVLPPAMLSAGLAIEALSDLTRRISLRASTLVLIAPLAAVVLTSALFLALEHREGIHKQRQVIRAVHDIFPEPVSYIDGYGMVSSFPRTGFFMSTWGMDSYHNRAVPIFKDILSSSQPKFLVANHRALIGLDGRINPNDPYASLLQEDQLTLREHFITHWGPVRVAGRRIAVETAGEAVAFQVLVPGPYTLEAEQTVFINDNEVSPGGIIELAQGRHRLLVDVAGTVTLRWGEGLVVPSQSPPTAWLFDGL